jgi:hypothetical protein
MDDDYDPRSGSAGSHILASVSKVRVEARARALPVVVVRRKQPVTGFTFTRHPKEGEESFVIVDEVRFSVFCLVIFGSLCGACQTNTNTLENILLHTNGTHVGRD